MNNITVISTSYFSGNHLCRLFNNLIDKSDCQNRIHFLVIDNTNGEDDKLNNHLFDVLNLDIIINDGTRLQRSISHSVALDIGLKYSKSDFTLIIDPDVHIFKEKWDTFCINFFKNNEKLVVGAPYPDWKLGKVHDYPSVVFMFFRTQKIENYFGITSPDTGKNIIEGCRDELFKPINFEACYPSKLKNRRASFSQYDMAKEFELYFYEEEPFMTHMYGSGVIHWKTDNGSDKNYWIKLIKEIENEIK